MFSDVTHRGTVPFLRERSLGPSKAASRRPAGARFHRDFGNLDHLSAQEVVLRAVIEEFGGEVLSSALKRRLVCLVSWRDARSDLWLGKILGDLEQCGALTLERIDGTDVIARIQPIGIGLAYDLPARER